MGFLNTNGITLLCSLIKNKFNSYYTKTEVDQLLENVEIDVDDALSASSTNPVQNKVIKAKIDDIEDEIDTKQDKEFIGTTAQWNALTTEQKNQYVLVNLTDDKEALGVDAVDAVTNGDMRPVTSNAVYDNFYSILGTTKVVRGVLAARSSATIAFEHSTRGIITIIGAGTSVMSMFIMSTDSLGSPTFASVLTGSNITYTVNDKYSVLLNNAYTTNPEIYVLLFTGNCTITY